MGIQKFTIPAAGGRKAFTLYAELANINYFLTTPLTADAAQGATNKQVLAKAHQRRQYPGDTALSNIPATNREILVDPTRRSGNSAASGSSGQGVSAGRAAAAVSRRSASLRFPCRAATCAANCRAARRVEG